MPVNYLTSLEDGESILTCVKLLGKWNGSLYKLVWKDLLIYMGAYYIISFIYRFALNDEHQENFESILQVFSSLKGHIPISFVLGFFVAGVISKWWDLWLAIPRLQKVAFAVKDSIIGNTNEEAAEVRTVILRYLNLGWLFLMRTISGQMKLRMKEDDIEKDENFNRNLFHNINEDRVVKLTYKKLISEDEMNTFDKIEKYTKDVIRSKEPYEPEYWVPLEWASMAVNKAIIHGYCFDPKTGYNVIEAIELVRNEMRSLIESNSMLVPLVYTQVVIIAVYSYFIMELFTAQFINPDKKIKGFETDFYIPVFTIFKFLFLMGWLKVAMCVMDPFGDDDEDFPVSDIFTHHLDFTYRQARLDSTMFPSGMEPARFKYKLQKNADEDSLHTFIEKINAEFNEVDTSFTKNEEETKVVCCAGK